MKKIIGGNLISFTTTLIVCGIILFFHFTLPRFQYSHYSTETAWDILSYYLYLPLTFIQHDIGIKDYNYIDTIFEHFHFSTAFYQAGKADNGNWVIVYTMGMAILYMPFFFIGHLWATLGGYPTDGFSYPYQFCVSTGMMVYILIGIFILRKILLSFFTDQVTSFVQISLLLGTNYFREATDYNMGPHAVLFAFYCLLIYNTIKWHKEPKKKYAIIIGIAIGFLTLIRPTEIICILIPTLWNIYDKESFFKKIAILKTNYIHLFLLILSVLLVGLPQMIYWKHQTGSFLYNSYRDCNSFDITTSYFTNVFFSFRKGWLIYTPIIIFSFFGFFALKNEVLKKSRIAIVCFVVFNVFILTHVPIWWNAGSFGQRFMVQSYAVLAIPMGAFFQYIAGRKMFLKVFVGMLCCLMILLNQFQTWQFVRWILPGDGMTWAYYKASFLKTSYLSKEDQSLLQLQRTYDPNEKFNDANHEYKHHTIGYFNLDDINTGEFNTSFLDTTFVKSGHYSYKLGPQSEFSPGLSMPFSQITKKDHAWIRYTLWYYPTSKMEETQTNIVLHVNHHDKPYGYRAFQINSIPYKLNEWNKFTVDYLTPLIQDDDDDVHAYIWFVGQKELYIDDMQIEAFERK